MGTCADVWYCGIVSLLVTYSASWCLGRRCCCFCSSFGGVSIAYFSGCTHSGVCFQCQLWLVRLRRSVVIGLGGVLGCSLLSATRLAVSPLAFQLLQVDESRNSLSFSRRNVSTSLLSSFALVLSLHIVSSAIRRWLTARRFFSHQPG